MEDDHAIPPYHSALSTNARILAQQQKQGLISSFKNGTDEDTTAVLRKHQNCTNTLHPETWCWYMAAAVTQRPHTAVTCFSLLWCYRPRLRQRWPRTKNAAAVHTFGGQMRKKTSGFMETVAHHLLLNLLLAACIKQRWGTFGEDRISRVCILVLPCKDTCSSYTLV